MQYLRPLSVLFSLVCLVAGAADSLPLPQRGVPVSAASWRMLP
jgi:hypothetical protein